MSACQEPDDGTGNEGASDALRGHRDGGVHAGSRVGDRRDVGDHGPRRSRWRARGNRRRRPTASSGRCSTRRRTPRRARSPARRVTPARGAGLDDPRVASPTAAPTMTAATTTRTGQRRSGPCVRRPAGVRRAHDALRCAGRGRRRRPDERGQQDDPRHDLDHDGERHVGELRQRELGASLGRWRTAPPSRTPGCCVTDRPSTVRAKCPAGRVPGVEGAGLDRAARGRRPRQRSQHGLPAHHVGPARIRPRPGPRAGVRPAAR